MSIDDFHAPGYEFLSNFYRCRGFRGLTLEHDYQASKFINHESIAHRILACSSPGQAKRIAQEYKAYIRSDWQNVSIGVMQKLLRTKFNLSTNPDLAQKLIDTYPHYLCEGNHWHDNFWGDCHCSRPLCRGNGHNHLGKLLMLVRDELIEGQGPIGIIRSLLSLHNEDIDRLKAGIGTNTDRGRIIQLALSWLERQ